MPLPELSGNPLVALPLLFLGGVLTSLTPCVYPMIPITVALVGGQAAGSPRRSRARVLALTMSYVVGLALVYASLGLFAGLTGTMFGTISTNPWLYFAMANLLLLAALAMLDVLPIRLPQSVLRRATATGEGEGQRIAGAFALGAASGLVAAPCTAPVMVGVLTWVAATGSATLGFLYLFAFSLGMCALLVAAGLSAGMLASLPRPGPWMRWVKRGFAAVLIGVAQYYLIEMGRLLI